jgi:hypothetical protein
MLRASIRRLWKRHSLVIDIRSPPRSTIFIANQARDLLTQIFIYLDVSTNLKEIQVGVKENRDRRFLGLEQLMKAMEFDKPHPFNIRRNIGRYLAVNNRGIQYIDGKASALYQALVASNFNKRMIHFKLRNRTIDGREWSLPRVWAAFDHLSLQELSVLDAGHVASSTSLASTPMAITPTYTMSIDFLNLVGCKIGSSCSVDTETLRVLANTTFLNLTHVELSDYTISSEQLVAFLRRVKSTVRIVGLKNTHLASGPWPSVFEALREFIHLHTLSLDQLTEAAPIPLATAVVGLHRNTSCQVQEQMQAFLSFLSTLIEEHARLVDDGQLGVWVWKRQVIRSVVSWDFRRGRWDRKL